MAVCCWRKIFNTTGKLEKPEVLYSFVYYARVLPERNKHFNLGNIHYCEWQ